VDKPKKIMWKTFLDFSSDFFVVFALLKMTLALFAMTILVLSYCHACDVHFEELDKLLCALTMSDLKG